jgi:hypothetical protein
VGDSKIAIFRTESLTIVIYINLQGQLSIEPIVEIEHAGFGVGIRISKPISMEYMLPPKQISIRIKRRLLNWIADVEEFQIRRLRLKAQEEIILQQKQSFCTLLGLVADRNIDSIDIEQIGRVRFTSVGVKLSDNFAPLEYKIAARVVKIIQAASRP